MWYPLWVIDTLFGITLPWYIFCNESRNTAAKNQSLSFAALECSNWTSIMCCWCKTEWHIYFIIWQPSSSPGQFLIFNFLVRRVRLIHVSPSFTHDTLLHSHSYVLNLVAYIVLSWSWSWNIFSVCLYAKIWIHWSTIKRTNKKQVIL